MLSSKNVLRFVLTTAFTLTLSLQGAFALNTGTITGAGLNIRQEGSISAPSLGKLAEGTKVAVLETKNGWVKVATEGTVGYVSNDYIVGSADADFHVGAGVITGNSVNLRENPGTDAKVLASLSQGTVVDTIGVKAGWYKVQTNGGAIGFIHPDYLSITKRTEETSRGAEDGDSSPAGTKTSDNPQRQEVLDYAAKYLGKPYKYGSKGPDSFDCSGFTYYVFKNFGISLASSSSTQYSNTTRVNKSDLLPGDLVFFSNGGSRVGHVGIYVGGGQFIHSSSPGDVVKYDTINSGYYNKNFISGGRVLSK